MATHTIEIKPPRWEVVSQLQIEILRTTNDWWAETKSREVLRGIAVFMDVVNEMHLINGDNVKELVEKLHEKGVDNLINVGV